MMKVKLTGPLITPKVRVSEVPEPDGHHSVDARLEEGDLYIHIHLGWKAFLAFGLLVVQTLYTLLVNNLNVV